MKGFGVFSVGNVGSWRASLDCSHVKYCSNIGMLFRAVRWACAKRKGRFFFFWAEAILLVIHVCKEVCLVSLESRMYCKDR